jgi:hypothetical protein
MVADGAEYLRKPARIQSYQPRDNLVWIIDLLTFLPRLYNVSIEDCRCEALQGARPAQACLRRLAVAGLFWKKLWLPAAGSRCVSAAGVLALRSLGQWLGRSEEDRRSGWETLGGRPEVVVGGRRAPQVRMMMSHPR